MTTGIALLGRVYGRQASQTVARLWRGMSPRSFVVPAAFVGLWFGSYAVFVKLFAYLLSLQGLGPLLINRVLSLFFASMFVMLMTSGAVVGLTTLYRSTEVEALMVYPFRRETLMAVKALEAVLWAGWAPVFLIAAVILAHATVIGGAASLAAGLIGVPVFVAVSASLGVLGLPLLIRVLPTRRIPLAVPIGFAAAACGLIWLARLPRFEEIPAQDAALIVNELFRHIRLAEWAGWPSQWMTTLLLDAVRGDWLHAGWRWWLLAMNALMVGQLVFVVGRRSYYATWLKTKAMFGSSRALAGRQWHWTAVGWLLRWVSAPVRHLVVKDMKTFVRDPAQWSQAVIFFGLIGVYVANIRTLPYNLENPFWQHLIGFLNLGSTALTVSMLSIRFVFPLMSSEGRYQWVLGLSHLTVSQLVWEKFWLSAATSVLITELLILGSCVMLRVEPLVLCVSSATMVLICLAISGMTVGIGAVYQDWKEENPAKILSGFGGTLLLVLSLCYVGTVVMTEGVSLHWYLTGQLVSAKALAGVGLTATGILVALTFFSIIVPMRAGMAALAAREY